MIVFWIVVALFVLGALLLTLPPLLRQARSGARAFALLVGLGIAAGSVSTYVALGRPDAAVPYAEQAAQPAQPAGTGNADAQRSVTPEQIEKMVAALAARLEAQPNDAAGWQRLARSYTVLGRYRDAALAMRRASQLLPGDPNLLAELADLLGMTQGKRLAGEPARLVQQALDLDPRHAKALALAGSVAFEARDYAAARGYWERLLGVLPPDSPMQRSALANIAQAASLERGVTPLAAAPAQAPAARQGAGLEPR
jgi:cytochrome c-type biogenesis protein CcmH